MKTLSDVGTSQSCDMLFEKSSPFDSKLATTWNGFCSWVIFEQFKQGKNGEISDDSALAKTREYQLKRYACNDSRTSENQETELPKDKSDILIFQTDFRNEMAQKFSFIKEQIKVACCPSDAKECSAYLDKVPLVYCDTKDCEGNDLLPAYTPASHSMTEPLVIRSTGQVVVKSMGLTKFKDKASAGIFLTYAFYHELGHACEDALSLGWKKDVATAAALYIARRKSTVTSENTAMRNAFSEFIDVTGGTASTIRCLQGLAQTATQPQFEGDSLVCPQVSADSYLVEGFADWIAIKTEPAESLLETLEFRACYSNRESTHPMVSDVLNCALKTPAVKEKIKTALRCH